MESSDPLSRRRLAGNAPGRGSIFLAVALISSIAFADPPKDAPTRSHACGERDQDLDAPGCAVRLKPGEQAAFDAVALDEQEDVRRERARVRAETKVEYYETGKVIFPAGGFVGLVIGVALAAAAISAGVTYAVAKK